MFSDKEYFISENSSIILVEGKDKYSFIQGIISNDIEILRKKPSIYCSMLTPQGRFLYDFFISNLNDIFCIECDNSIQQELYERLLMYKLRSDVKIRLDTDLEVVLTGSKMKKLEGFNNKFISFYDPRFNNFLCRTYKEKMTDEPLRKFTKLSKEHFKDLRLQNSIPDFTVDAIRNKSLLLEMRFDELNGISWSKGCYMGQEITARMKYRNTVKKKIYTVKIDFKNSLTDEIFFENKVIGSLHSHNNCMGLAFLKTDFGSKNHLNFLSGDSQITVKKPWWSKD
jgi:hypothetical protein|tara:strand:- start:664 stop:1512 length:849 start_codon:yes stop_codon:yes gene_type:complete